MKSTPENRLTRILVGLLAPGAVACALTSKAEPVEVRYFSLERMQLEPRHARERANTIARAPLRLGRVESGPHLRERIAHRETGYELGFYDDLRWAERPEVYVRRALGRSLFEQRGMQRVLGADAPTLDVEVVAFDDVRSHDTRAAHIRLLALLFHGPEVIWQGTVIAHEPVAGSSARIEDVVVAMSHALESATESLAASVEVALRAREHAPSPGQVP